MAYDLYTALQARNKLHGIRPLADALPDLSAASVILRAPNPMGDFNAGREMRRLAQEDICDF